MRMAMKKLYNQGKADNTKTKDSLQNITQNANK